MLPFLKNKQDAAVAMPVEVQKREPDDESEYDTLESAGQDLIDAVHAKDARAVAAALRAGFELMESEPHREGSE